MEIRQLHIGFFLYGAVRRFDDEVETVRLRGGPHVVCVARYGTCNTRRAGEFVEWLTYAQLLHVNKAPAGS